MEYCQSCGMPMGLDKSNYALEKDGSKSEHYCTFCYKDGEFLNDLTMEQMVNKLTPFITAFKTSVNEEYVRKILSAHLPKLKRWNVDQEIKDKII